MAALLATPCTPAQTLDTFKPDPDQAVRAFAFQADKFLVAGNFTRLAGQTRYLLGRFASDDSLETLSFQFSPPSMGAVYALLAQPDGGIVFGGGFSAVGGQPRVAVARIKPAGTLDSGFAVNIGGYSPGVWAVAAQPDGKVIVGGGFSFTAGITVSNLARFGVNGKLDTNFVVAVDGVVRALALQTDGKILVGGDFNNLGGQPRRIGRLTPEGAPDDSFDLGSTMAGTVYTLLVQPDGKILVGGTFASLCGQPRNRMGRLHPEGTLDVAFDPAIGNGAIPGFGVYCFTLQADGKILVGGSFTNVGGLRCTNIARLNPNGTLDAAFNPGASYPSVLALALRDDGRVLVGGAFTNLAGRSCLRLGRLLNDSQAVQDLSLAGSTITWTRSGTTPEVWRTVFEATSDGTNWTFLGSGTRTANGWDLAAAQLSSYSAVRARGFVQANGSEWFVEQTLPLPPPIAGVILVDDIQFGLRSGQFGFNFTGTAGQTIIVEASANLTAWVPLATNLLGGAPLYFSDPDTSQFPVRFYRLRLDQ